MNDPIWTYLPELESFLECPRCGDELVYTWTLGMWCKRCDGDMLAYPSERKARHVDQEDEWQESNIS